MIKINKQVAKSKISSFLKINEIVLFFHCNNNVSLYKNDDFIGLNKIQNTCQTHKDCVTSINGSYLYETFDTNTRQDNKTSKKPIYSNHNTFKCIYVKNRLAKKVFLEVNAFSSLYFQKEDLTLKKEKECLIASLFQGPTLLLGCSNINLLERGVEAFASHKGLFLLGAFYDNSIIDHSQIKRLIATSKNNQGYKKLIFSMKDPFLHSFSLIRDLLSMRSLLVQQKRFIFLLKMRKEQLLVTNS